MIGKSLFIYVAVLVILQICAQTCDAKERVPARARPQGPQGYPATVPSDDYEYHSDPVPKDDDDDEEEAKAPTDPEDDCDWKLCPRVYEPVCGSIDGKPYTAPTQCDFDNKVLCIHTKVPKGAKIPKVVFQHVGEC